MWFLLAGCQGDDVGPTDTQTPSEGPSLSTELSIPTGAAPLVRRLVVTSDVPVTLLATWSDGTHEATKTVDTASENHDLLLLGWHAGATYALTVTGTDASGESTDVALEVVTDPLPAHFPNAVLTVDGTPAPGHTLVPIRVAAVQGDPDSELVMVFDEAGEVCFWLAVGALMQDVNETPEGLLVLEGDLDAQLVLYGWDGLEIRRYAMPLSEASAGAVTIQAAWATKVHHEAYQLPNGDFLALGRYPLAVPTYPSDYTSPAPFAPRLVADDVLLSFDVDGNMLDETLLSTMFDLHRLGFDSLDTTVDGWADWAHANAAIADGDDVILSLRHQDAVVKIDPQTDSIVWILGQPDNWSPELDALRLTPEGALDWPWHQHAPQLGPDTSDGRRTLLMFDNGNWQAAPWTGVPPVVDPALLTSRIVQFSIDEAAATFRQDWVFDQPEGGRLFSEAVGDVDTLSNGDVLSTWGLLDATPDGLSNDSQGLGHRSVRLIEFDPVTLDEVWHLYLSTQASDNASGWSAYRSERIPSLYGR